MKSDNKKLLTILRSLSIILMVTITFGCLTFPPAIAGVNDEVINEKTITEPVSTELPVDRDITSTKKARKLIEKPIKYTKVQYKKFYSIAKSESFITGITSKIATLNKALKTNNYTDSACEAMTKEVSRLKKIKVKVNADIKKYETWESEYYYAAKTWEYFKQRGFSDAVVSGIIGNMMIETSGGSLALKPTIYNPSEEYYGLCQWSLKYRPSVADMSFENQLDYLYSDLKPEFNVFGNCYYRGFTYEEFIKIANPAEAALAFAAAYERCGSGSYDIREQAAIVAYNYFTK